MIIDGALQFSGTAGTAGSSDSPTTGTQVSNNVIDLLNARDMGIGDDPALKLLVIVTTPFTGGTSLQVNLSLSDTVTFVINNIVISGPVITEANLIQGTHLLDVDWPRVIGALSDRLGASEVLPRYARLQYVSVGTHGAGALFGAVVLDRQDQISYPPGIVIAN